MDRINLMVATGVGTTWGIDWLPETPLYRSHPDHREKGSLEVYLGTGPALIVKAQFAYSVEAWLAAMKFVAEQIASEIRKEEG